MIETIDIDEITPLHEARNPELVNGLADDMRKNGWHGRPLLLIERTRDYLAWTGSHRIAAAKKAGLASVPCYVIQERVLLSHGFDAEHGHVMDYERLQIVKRLGDETALHIMRQEGQLS